MSRLPAILTPVEFERVDDGIRAKVKATVDGTEVLHITARLTRAGIVWDLQAQGLGERWTAGTTGNDRVDRLVLAALEREFVAGRNAAVLAELTSPRRRKRRWYQ